MFKKFKAVIFAAIVMCFLFSLTALATENGTEGKRYAKGYIPERIDYSHLKNNPPILNRNSRCQ